MITTKYMYENGNMKMITVKGHANYKKHGEDIICAAVSTATFVTANAIEHLGLNHLVDVSIEEGYFKLSLKESNQVTQKLLENLKYTLDDLEKQYPKYMKNQKEG